MEGKLKQGEALFAEEKIQEAEECFLDLIEQYPEDHEILNNLGVISFARGDQKAAEDYFLKALAGKDDYQDALMNLNTLYQDSKGWKMVPAPLENANSAISFFREAQKLFPNDYTLPGNLGFLFLKRGKFQQAEDALKKALELKPDYSDALYTIGKLYMAQGRFVEALHVFEACLSVDSSHEPARSTLAECREKNTPAAARERYKKILIVMEEGIGNMVMLTPAIRALKVQLPEAHITVLCREPSSQVIDGWNMVERVILQPDDGSYDIGFLTIWSQNYQRLYWERIRKQCKTVYTVPMNKLDIHETDHHLKIARLFGYAGDNPDSFCIAKDIDLDVPLGKKLIGLSDTTLNKEGWERKRWPYYRELAGQLLEKGYAVVMIGGQGEAERFNPKDWPQDVINALGKYDVQGTAGILKKCHMFIGNDSGPAHMAAALGVPTLVLFGPTLVSKNKPFGRKVEIVSRRLPCSPCQYTQRWEGCEDFRCMNEITVDHILARVTAISITEIELHAGPLQLVAKDYDEARLITEDNIKYVWENGIREPLRIHLVGAGKANFPWGMENEIRRALELEGIEVIETDYRIELDNFANRFLRPAHIMLVCKGSGISPELIRQYPGTTLLWYQDDVFTTAHAPRDLAFNGCAFDRVYFFDNSALEECRKSGISDVHWLPLAMSPALHRKMYLAKKHDVSFVGNIHPNRKPFFERLQKRFNILVKQAFMDEMVRIFNQSKIVLNLGIGPTGIQQRVFEALACGSFLLTNEIPSDGHLFEDRKHLVYFNEQNIETLIAYYLEHEEERERIAYQGYLEAHAKHTFQQRIRQLLKKTFTCVEESSSAGVATSQARVAINKKGKRRLLVFWHGIGDNIMATPALRAFRETHPDDFIGYMYLKRIHKDELMNECPYVDAVHTCSDAWDDYPDYEIGVKAVIEEAKQLASREGYDEVIPITMRTMPLTHHRIERIAYELGVPLSNWSTELWISKEERKEADRNLSAWGIGTDDFIVAIHRRGANIHKYWEADEAQKVIDYLKAHYNAKVIAFETHTDLNREPTKQLKGVFSTADLGELPLKVSAALIDRCNLYIGLDSGPMWLATTTTTPLVALFTMTWMHQSAPLRANSVVVASDQSWQMANDAFKQRLQDRIVHDPTGGTKIKAESVLQAIAKLDLGLSEVTPHHDFNKQSITPSKPTLARTPPDGFYQMEACPDAVCSRKGYLVDSFGGYQENSYEQRGRANVISAGKELSENESVRSIDMHQYRRLQLKVEDDEPVKMRIEDYGPDAAKFRELILKQLPKPEDLPAEIGKATVLDLGCNTAYNTQLLAACYGDAVGVDLNANLIRHAVDNWSKCYVMDMHYISFKGGIFDLVFAKDVLEHAYDPEQVLADIFRVLKPGGIIVALIPMDGSHNGPAIDMCGGYPVHVWKTTYKDCEVRFQRAGFENIQIFRHSHLETVDRPRKFGDGLGVIIAKKPFTGKANTSKKKLYIPKRKLVLPKKYYDPNAYWAAFLTLQCTSRCPYCIQRINSEGFKRALAGFKVLSGDDWLDILNGLDHSEGQRLAVTGGEPTIHPDFIKIINGLEGYTITVTTNLNSPFYQDLNRSLTLLRPTCLVRFNTSFHPECMTAEEFCHRIQQMKEAGLWVDQIAMVDHPASNFKHYQEVFAEYGIGLTAQDFLGYWNGCLYPHPDDRTVKNDPREHGITDLVRYHDGFSAQTRRPMLCCTKRVLIGPDGMVYNCHSRLYSRSKIQCGSLPEGHLELPENFFQCEDYGFCNPCDYPHVTFKPIEQAESSVAPGNINKSENAITIAGRDLSSFYDANYFGKTEERTRYVFKPMAQYLKAIFCPQKALDVGCGMGFLIKWLRTIGVDAYGCDHSAYAIKHISDSPYLTPKGLDVRECVQQETIEQLSYSDSNFDLVTCLDVFEHLELEQACRAIRELDRVTSRYIFMIITVHDEPDKDLILPKGAKGDPTHVMVTSKEYWHRLFAKETNLIHRQDLEDIIYNSGLGKILPWTFFIYEKNCCPVCGGVFEGPKVKDLLACNKCGTYRKMFLPPQTALLIQLKNMILGSFHNAANESERRQVAELQLQKIEKFINIGRVFDVGAGSGLFLKVAQEHGWGVDGNEASKAAITFAQKKYQLSLRYGLLEDLDIKERYNAFVLWHTLEHTINPAETLRYCHDHLSPDGILQVAVPLKPGEQLEKRYESMHFYEFGRENLFLLIENCGFKVVDAVECSPNQDLQINVIARRIEKE